MVCSKAYHLSCSALQPYHLQFQPSCALHSASQVRVLWWTGACFACARQATGHVHAGAEACGRMCAQVLEVLADDSNFRRAAMDGIATPAAAALALPPQAFESAWCAGEPPASSFSLSLSLSVVRVGAPGACTAPETSRRASPLGR